MIRSTSLRLKVCKIDSLNFASYAIKQQVDMLGVHVLTEQEIGKHIELVKYINSNDGKAIIVTKINMLAGLEHLIEFYDPAGLQLHFEPEQELVLAVKKKFPQLILIGVVTDELAQLDEAFLSEHYDFLIYDNSYLGGSGNSSQYRHLGTMRPALKSKVLLAGGIDNQRIIGLSKLKIAGFDIQSHFRTDIGISFKNLDRICDYLKAPRKDMLSVSLTDLPLISINQAASYYSSKNLEYHLDFSPGNLYPSFDTGARSIEEKMDFISRLPYSLHVFIHGSQEILAFMNKVTRKYPLNLVRLFIQYYAGLDLDAIFQSINHIKIVPSIYYKDLDTFLKLNLAVKVISIIVPNFNDKASIQKVLNTVNENTEYFEGKEIWFDRNLDQNYITLIRESISFGCNFIIGKEVIGNWNKINEIHESIS